MNRPETRYARCGDLNIAYQVVGSGPLDLVFVPGFISHLDLLWTMPTWEGFVSRLSSIGRVAFFDKRGQGLSDPTSGYPDLDARMDDIRAVMDAVGMDSANLIGFSEGGPLSVLFAASYPERTRALVLLSTTAYLDPEEEAYRMLEDAIDHWGEGRLLSLMAPSMADTALARWGTGMFERASLSPAMARALWECIRSMDVRDVLPAIQAPTLVVSRSDEILSARFGRAIAEMIPGARFVEIPGVDHPPWIGDYDSVIDPIEEFLTGTKQAPIHDRTLATVLFTDIARSTERNAQIGDDAWRRLLDEHHAIVRRHIASFRGREVKTIGDGFLVTFDGPARALRCARAIVHDVREIGVDVRAGLHTGEIEVLEEGDVGGMAVNIAARVAAYARAGEVLTSSTVKDLVVGSSYDFTSRGTQELKGVPGRWSLFAFEGQPGADRSAMAARDLLGPVDRVAVNMAGRAPRVARAVGRLIARPSKDPESPGFRRRRLRRAR